LPVSACAEATDAVETGGIAMKRELTREDRKVGGGVAPVDLPEAKRAMKTADLRALGLPFECKGGRVLQDHSTSDPEEQSSEEREPRIVYWQKGGEFFSVDYTRPTDIAIASTFDPWPDEDEAFVTLYDEEDGELHPREVGDDVSDLH
jgi:hypothetical protein